MNELIAGLILFFAVHSISIVNDAWRNRMASRLGQWGWKGLYGLAAIVGLMLMVRGYGNAHLAPIPVYEPPAWLDPVALALLVPVFPLLLAAYLPGRIKAVTVHPMLLAVMLWAAAHLMVNGSLADVLLFGAFLVWAVADRLSLQRRVPRAVPSLPATGYNDVIAVIGRLALHAAFVFRLHAWLIGVPAIGP
jgi:uncharacterized membrane protein